MEKVASTFLECPELLRLEISDRQDQQCPFDSIANKCRRFQLAHQHDLFVEVLGVDY